MGDIHFCNVGCADCTVIRGASDTYLIDCSGIDKHSHLLPTSKHIRGVFISHQHRDHFNGLEYLLENKYRIDFLIYSPYQRREGDNSVEYDEWNEFEDLRQALALQGTQLRKPFRDDNVSNPYWKCGDVTFYILAPFHDIATSSTRELHDACLVVLAQAGQRKFLVCGDASDTSLNKLAHQTNNYCDDVLRCSHHGSINGADLDFIKKANAINTVISTAADVHPSVPDELALQRYRDNTKERVYRTDRGGTVSWNF